MAFDHVKYENTEKRTIKDILAMLKTVILWCFNMVALSYKMTQPRHFFNTYHNHAFTQSLVRSLLESTGSFLHNQNSICKLHHEQENSILVSRD